MNQILELRQKHAKLVADMNDILTRSKDGLKGDDEAAWEKMFGDSQAVLKQLRACEATEAVKAEADKYQSKLEEADAATKRTGVITYDQAYREWMLRGVADMSSEHRTVLQTGFQTRAQAVGTQAAGGYTVPQGFSNQLAEALLAFGGMLSAGDAIQTETGAVIPWPTNDDTTNKGAIIAENTAMTDQDLTFGVVNLNAYMYTSKFIKVSLQFMQDTFLNVEQFVMKTASTRLGRILNDHFTTGTGTNEPQGIVTGAALGKTGANGQTTSVTHDDLLDLIFSVDPAYRSNASGFMLHDLTWKVVMKMKDSTGRPLVWNDSGSLQEGIPTRLLGYPVFINQSMPTMTNNAKSILFGAFKNYKIRIARDTVMVRLNERFAELNQVAFVTLWRGDGRLISGGAPIKYYANSNV